MYRRLSLRMLPALYLLLVILPILGHYGLWFDEIFSVVMSRDIASIVQMVRTQENNMLLHYLLLWLWMPLGNNSEIFLRASSVLLVLLSLLPLHAAARRLAGHTVAHAACLLYVSHFLVLQHVQACRGYALALLMTALVFWSWARAWQTGKYGHWLQAGCFAGLGVWSHYFSALVPVVLVFAMWWRDGWRLPWRQLLLASAVFLVLAWVIVLTRPPDGAAQIAWAEVPDMRSIIGTLWMLGGADGLREQPLLAVMLLSVGLALLWRWRWWSGAGCWRNTATGIAVGLLLVVLAVLLESFVAQPLFVYRFFTALVPLYCFVLAAALAVLWPWWRMLLVALTLALSAWETWKPFISEPVPVRYWWKPMVQQMLPALQPGDAVLVYPAFLRMPVDYYLDYYDPQNRLPRPVEYSSGPYRQGGGVEPEPDWQRLHDIAANTAGRVWLVTDEKTHAGWSRLQRVHAPAIRTQLLYLHGRQPVFQQRHGTMTVQGFDRLPAATP